MQQAKEQQKEEFGIAEEDFPPLGAPSLGATGQDEDFDENEEDYEDVEDIEDIEIDEDDEKTIQAFSGGAVRYGSNRIFPKV